MNRRLSYNCRCILVCLFLLLGGFLLLSPTREIIFAEKEETIFDKKEFYDVYYEVSKFEIDCLENVKVLGTVLINDISFLVVSGGIAFLEGKEGYILLSSVRAILPKGFRPKQIFDTGKPKRP